MIYVCFWSKIGIVVAMETKQNIKKDEIYTFCSVFYQLSVNWAKLSPFSAKKDEIYTFCSVFYQLSVNWAKLSPFSAKLKK